eukprot:CAMPEP_0172519066 /NCGR_PEP_ID=MMETSP1066-20121228/291193_1 /TAXON_ID=671091 /ORGANISM="Coscinodiscus wailesii, Strain CCMP2513" /LENGTH=124 /DNA_ID=CAMNT_0013301577 /DNA_START=255 /DNA_END=630 /DNA_ORIENTATION=+
MMNVALDRRTGLVVIRYGQCDGHLLGLTARSDGNWQRTMKVDKWRKSTGINDRPYNGDGKKQQTMMMTVSDGKACRRYMMTIYDERQTTAMNNDNDDEGWRRMTTARDGNEQRPDTKVMNEGDD